MQVVASNGPQRKVPQADRNRPQDRPVRVLDSGGSLTKRLPFDHFRDQVKDETDGEDCGHF